MIKQGLIWDFLGKIVNQLVSFGVTIVLARLLFPEDFALIAMIMAFYSLARIFIDFGFSAAIVQQPKVSQIQFSSIFWFSSVIGLLLSGLCYFSAELISDFYEQEKILLLAQTMSFIILLSAFGGIHSAILQKELAFKKIATIGVVSAVLSGIFGVTFALLGFGVWSLVIQYYVSGITRLILLWRATRWIPSFKLSWRESKPLLMFGKNLFFSQLLNAFFTQLDVFVIGKLFVPATLGFYSRSKSLNQLIAQHSSGSLNAVLFPAISKIQNDREAVKKLVVKFFHLAAFISFFLGGWLYLIAQDVIVILFTDKWLPSVPYFRIMVLSTFAYPVSAIVLNPINSLGRSDIFLKLEIVKRILISVVYLIGFQYGIFEFLYGMLMFSFLAVLMNCFVSGRIINWSLISQVKALLAYGIPMYGLSFTIDRIVSFYDLDLIPHLLISTFCFVPLIVLYSSLKGLQGFETLQKLVSERLGRVLRGKAQ